MQFWDKLPPEERRKHIRSRLTPGRVLLLHCTFTTPPKNKFLVLASVNPEPLFFVINSAVNEFIRQRDHLMQCQVTIRHEEHPFLNHHSFINCAEIQKLPLENVYEQIEKDINLLKGEIDPATRDQVIAAVKFARTLTLKQKAEILAALR